ncbi:DUF6953 family protein [Aeromonas dhakensis]|uniref:DUF6953 family protein n=1 Tax=Aeromonas dhakensis TaxID=196024 RepID=UPI0029D8B60F|nr:hypothetical protein [Aeromonas dhakensis]MDX7830352.1 hypothetical protein [Aeromonas dhakensis]
MTPAEVSAWMVAALKNEGCIYQDDVVDYLVKSGNEQLLKENADGNQAVGKAVLDEFLKATRETVVWVKPDFYWRWRVPEDEEGRNARG